MLCLVFVHSRFYVATLIFYTCIWIPFIQIKQALLRIIGLVFGASPPDLQQQLLLHHHHYFDDTTTDDHHQLIPVMKYEELEHSSRVNNERIMNGDHLCSVCLGELGRGEELSQLPGCLHVFHFGCIRSWVDSNQFTCPLCRSPVLTSPMSKLITIDDAAEMNV